MKLICSLGHCSCNSHTVHKLSQWHLTADWLVPRERDCSWRFPLTGCQVTPRSCDWFSRYSKWLDTLRTGLVFCFTIILKYPTFISSNNADEKLWTVLRGLDEVSTSCNSGHHLLIFEMMWIRLHIHLPIWHAQDSASWYIPILKANKMQNFSTLFGKELYMCWTDLLPIIRSLNTVFTAIGICHTSYVAVS